MEPTLQTKESSGPGSCRGESQIETKEIKEKKSKMHKPKRTLKILRLLIPRVGTKTVFLKTQFREL
jgi:hypothetical protein